MVHALQFQFGSTIWKSCSIKAKSFLNWLLLLSCKCFCFVLFVSDHLLYVMLSSYLLSVGLEGMGVD